MKYSLRTRTPNRRFQFTLKSLFVMVTAIALSIGLLLWLRSQMAGNLMDVDISTGPGKILFFQCANNQDARELFNDFDHEGFLASVRKSLPAARMDTPFAFYPGTTDNGFFIKCDFPVDEQNAAIFQGLDQAGQSYAASHPKVLKFASPPLASSSRRQRTP